MQKKAEKFKNMRVKNIFSADEFEKEYEVNDEPSLTIPDQTMSIKEILNRFASGLPIDGQKVPIYDESESEEYFPDPRYMDLADRQEMAENYKQELQAYQTKAEETKSDVNSEAE
jgi:hypothetical protein